jgi:hypothetical protein
MSRIIFEQAKCFIGERLNRNGKGAVADPEVWRRPVNHNSVARPAL